MPLYFCFILSLQTTFTQDVNTEQFLGGTKSEEPSPSLASEEANWSGSALFVIQYENLYQQSGSRNLIGWQLELGVAS